MITRKPMPMDAILPDWLEKGVESSLRESEYDVPVVVIAPTAPIVLTETTTTRDETDQGYRDLDSFYEEVEESEDEEEDQDESGDDDDDVIEHL